METLIRYLLLHSDYKISLTVQKKFQDLRVMHCDIRVMERDRNVIFFHIVTVLEDHFARCLEH